MLIKLGSSTAPTPTLDLGLPNAADEVRAGAWFEHCSWDLVIRDPVVRDMPEAVAGSAANDATPVDQDVIVHPDCVFLEMAGHSLKMDPVGLIHLGCRDGDVGWKGPHVRQSASRRGLASCPVRPSPASDHPRAGLEGQIRTGLRSPPSLAGLLRRRDSGPDPIGPCSLGSEDSKLSAPALAQ